MEVSEAAHERSAAAFSRHFQEPLAKPAMRGIKSLRRKAAICIEHRIVTDRANRRRFAYSRLPAGIGNGRPVN